MKYNKVANVAKRRRMPMAMPAFPPGLKLCFFGGIGAGVGVVLEVLVVGPVYGFDTASCAFVVSGGCAADSDIAAAGVVCTVDATSAAGVAAAASTASSDDCLPTSKDCSPTSDCSAENAELNNSFSDCAEACASDTTDAHDVSVECAIADTEATEAKDHAEIPAAASDDRDAPTTGSDAVMADSEDCTAANDSCAILRAEKGFRCKINSEVCCKVYSGGPQGNKMKH